MPASWEESHNKLRQHLKKQRHHIANKGPHSQSYGFSCSHVWKWELDYKKGWPLKNWCFWIGVLEENKLIHSESNQLWVLTGRTDPEAEAPILWLSHEKRRLRGKDPDVGKMWRQKGMTEDEMVGQCHWSDQHEFDQTPGGRGRRAWRALVHGIMKSWTWLND